VGNWQVDGAESGWLLGHMRHFAARPGGIYQLDFPAAPPPTDLAVSIENMLNASDTFVIGIRYSGSVAARVFISTYDYVHYITDTHAAAGSWASKHDYTLLGSRQAVIDSAGQTYWQDTANNIVWVKVSLNHPTLGEVVQFKSNPLGIDGLPVGPLDEHYLYNPIHLRIWQCAVAPPAACD